MRCADDIPAPLCNEFSGAILTLSASELDSELPSDVVLAIILNRDFEEFEGGIGNEKLISIAPTL